MRTCLIEMELRGQQVLLECKASPPESDVGIMGWGPEEETITDADGNVLDWELTQDELYEVSGKMNQMASDGYFDYDWSDERI